MSDWRSYHLYYHGDRDLLLRELIDGLLRDWLRAGRLAGFFFIRYPLGGDHVRFRFRAAEGADGGQLGRELEARAADFFARFPSADTKTAEQIAAEVAATLASDPNEKDPGVQANNSCVAMEFIPEVERYGGAAALPWSLQLFGVSSLRALELLGAAPEASRGSRLTAAMALLVEQAAAFARSREELAELVGYGLAWAGGNLESPLVAKADRVFAGQAEPLTLGLGAVAAGTAEAFAAGAALACAFGGLRRRLAEAGIERGRQLEIGKSQLHMTANRLGLINAEEVYVSRLAGRACESWLEPAAGAERLAGLAAAWESAARGGADLDRAAIRSAQEFLDPEALRGPAQPAGGGAPSAEGNVAKLRGAAPPTSQSELP